MFPVMFVVLLALTLLGSQASAQNVNNTLEISVYFESRCPDSVRFITTQLYPGFELLGDYLDIDFVPFGKAEATNVDGAWNFTCQHGPRECYGNIIQSCVLALFPRSAAVDFIFCAMASGEASDDSNISNCAVVAQISVDAINSCYDSGLGADLLAANGYRTAALEPKLSYVPTILFNSVYDDELQEEGEFNFLPTACGLLGNEPEACASA